MNMKTAKTLLRFQIVCGGAPGTAVLFVHQHPTAYDKVSRFMVEYPLHVQLSGDPAFMVNTLPNYPQDYSDSIVSGE